MTKAELITAVAEASDLTKKDAEKAVAATLDAITEAMKNGEKVQLVGFGTFEGKDRPERTCMNPATKQKITVKATRVPTFKAGKALKEVIAK